MGAANTSNPPLVSVCIPVYNDPDGLKRTLDSIINQTYQNIEIIASDDHSPNPSVWELLSDYASKDPRISISQQPVNVGPDINYQFVYDKAKGKYMMFAQDNDLHSSGFIEKLVDALESNETTPVAMCNSQYMNSEGKRSPIYPLNNISVFNIVGNGAAGFVCMGLWRREDYGKYLVKTPKNIIGGDHIIIAHAMLATGSSIPIVHSELYTKDVKPGGFEWSFKEFGFWYSFRTWHFMIKSLAKSPLIPTRRKLLLPAIAITNLGRACAVTGGQIICTLPDDNILKRLLKKHFFGAN